MKEKLKQKKKMNREAREEKKNNIHRMEIG